MSDFTIVEAQGEDDFSELKALFKAYAHSLGIDLGFQGFDLELANIPGRYARPQGASLLARSSDGYAIGCVALRPLSEGICEMKRLYVAPRGRRLGLGRRLALDIISEARKIGYRAMRLDTLSSMTNALALYESLGFRKISPYYATPHEQTVFLELKL
ncbi:hypothetical protein AMS68_001928 [Peltaster fructicola]|uniref:N-acetyltransferase domain-containing protein n=1 Tax=Peltaster fructicola TaxID=286661 RepID=A0A6H0XP28_9PEZI|nr:hypothetical protein AMS68_001928 [Peltaster fructicola]